jgi:ubiquinone/menaquinone biosynthesis C-methylase UbiE
MEKEAIRHQFNKQAQQFAGYELTRNETIFQFTFDFCEFQQNDTLLDVACGSGVFAIFCADKLQHATGIDISDKLIKYAKKHAEELRLANVEFIRGDVEGLPFPDASFSIVSCRSALHHMKNCNRVIKEMARCAKNSGKICIQDMTAYQQSNMNEFFEEMEKEIDLSHLRALTSKEIQELFSASNIKIEKIFEAVLTHNLNEYIGHAHQSRKQLDALEELISIGLNDHAISEWLFYEDGNIQFKRSGIIIWGTVL